MAEVTGVKSTARNPVNPPKDGDFPRINIFEMDDAVKEKSMRGGSQYPSYKRDFSVLVETFIKASSEQAGPKELSLFIKELKKKMYESGATLGLKGVELSETATGEVLRPPNLDLVIGVGIVLSIRYVEDVSKIMV
jgi:hypothetical protein